MKLLKNYFTIVILIPTCREKNLYAQFEKKNEILRRYAPQNDTTQEFFRILLILLFIIILLSCEKGISPSDTPEVKPGFGGTITYVSSPPPRESLIQLRIIAVPYYPIDTVVATLIDKIAHGVIPYSDTLQRSSIDSGNTQRYEFFVQPGEYKYVAVVQQYGLLLYEDWRVISIYGFSQSTPFPRPVTVTVDKFQAGIDFIVDFKNLPPQPFKK